MSSEEVEVLRRSISDHLGASRIYTFQFGAEDARQSPFTVCSAPSDDDDNMDASLLMSPDYVRPLIRSELGLLIQQIFDKDTGFYLRHLASSKLVRARRGSTPLTLPASISRAHSNPASIGYPTPLGPPSMLSLQTMGSHTGSSGAGMSPYVQARIADHTQQEEKIAQIRLAKWAADLQRSLQNERTKYEALVRSEQSIWLNEKLQEFTQEDPSGSTRNSALIKRSDRNHRRRRSATPYQCGLTAAEDPLGLLQWNEIMRRKICIAFQVAGGFGILGAMAVWAAKAYSLGVDGDGNWTVHWWKGN